MSDNGKGLRTEVLVALIGLIGVVAVSLIENWDKIFSRSSPATSPLAVGVQTPTPTPIQIQTPTPDPSLDPGASVIPRLEPGQGVGIPDGFHGFSQETDTSLSGCTVTIARPFVRLMSEASHSSPSVLEVRQGSYPATVYRLVSFGGGAIKEGWFQTQVEGRIGWINSEAIGTKTSGCP